MKHWVDTVVDDRIRMEQRWESELVCRIHHEKTLKWVTKKLKTMLKLNDVDNIKKVIENELEFITERQKQLEKEDPYYVHSDQL